MDGYATIHQLLKRGWTRPLVVRLLGEPDIRGRYQEKLWSWERVKEIEEKAKALPAVKNEVERRRLINVVDSVKIRVNVIPLERARKNAMRSYNSRQKGNFIPATEVSDKDFLDRITVNYLRHNETKYDEISRLLKLSSEKEAYSLLRVKTLRKIAEKYPELKKECRRQEVSWRDLHPEQAMKMGMSIYV